MKKYIWAVFIGVYSANFTVCAQNIPTLTHYCLTVLIKFVCGEKKYLPIQDLTDSCKKNLISAILATHIPSTTTSIQKYLINLVMKPAQQNIRKIIVDQKEIIHRYNVNTNVKLYMLHDLAQLCLTLKPGLMTACGDSHYNGKCWYSKPCYLFYISLWRTILDNEFKAELGKNQLQISSVCNNCSVNWIVQFNIEGKLLGLIKNKKQLLDLKPLYEVIDETINLNKIVAIGQTLLSSHTLSGKKIIVNKNIQNTILNILFEEEEQLSSQCTIL